MNNSQTLHMPLDENPNSPFIQAIEQIEQGITPKKPYIPMGNPPEVLQLVGIPDLKMRIAQRVIFKVIYNHLSKEAIEKLPYGVKDNLHGILPDDLKKLPQELNNPIAIFKSRTTGTGGFLVLTEIKENKNSNELPVTVAINLKVQSSEIEAVNVSSAYGREFELLAKDFSEDLLYIDTKKGHHFLTTHQLQLPRESHRLSPREITSELDDLPTNIKTQHDLSQAKFAKDYAYLKKNLGDSARFITLTTTLPDGQPLLGEGVHLRGGRAPGQTYINPERITPLYNQDGDEILTRQERLLWVANHELFHRGFSVIGKEETERALEQAMTHPVVKELADIIQDKRKTYAPHLPELSPYQACEEALAELYAMREAGSAQPILDRYNDLKTYPQLEQILENAPLDSILNPHQQSQEQTASALFKRDIQFDDQALNDLLNRIGEIGKTHSIDYNRDFDFTDPETYYSEKIEDFGEHIAGAKKETYNLSTLSDEEIQKLPLSKLWNQKDIDAIEDKNIAAIAQTLRDAIPSKPRKSYKVRNWFDQLEKSQLIVNTLLEKNDPTYTNETLNKFEKAYLLSKLDKKDWKRIGEVNHYPQSEELRIEIDKTTHWLEAKTRENYVPLITEILEKTPTKAPQELTAKSFDVYKRHIDQSAFICATADRAKTPLVEFKNTSEALAYLKEEDNIKELNRLWLEHKELNSINKSDMRNKENTTRTGINRRQEDISPEQFMDTFGIRGGQFGNWVKDEERQAMLNASYDGFLDMAEALKIDPKAIGLNGTLGIAFGARGSGNASAHYEPTEKVINLTKTKGAGSLAHEWWHALDHYLGKQNQFLTEAYHQSDNHYEAMQQPIKDLIKTFSNTKLETRSIKADKRRQGQYFSTNVEMSARAFEAYIKNTLAQQGIRNDYLVNIQEEKDWQKNKEAYPYPIQNELEEFNKAYNNIFAELKKVDKLFERPLEQAPQESKTTEQETPQEAQNQKQEAEKNVETKPKTSEQEIKNQEEKNESVTAVERFRRETLKEIIEAVRNQTAPWQQSWRAGELCVPYNGYNNNIYQGGNILRLSLAANKNGYRDQRWFTYNQLKELGASVHKGEKATGVLYYRQYEIENKETGEIEQKSGWGWHNLFNIEQSNLLEKHPEFKLGQENRPNIDAIQKILDHHQPKIINGEPAYNPKLDIISMPEKNQFQDEASYYGTLLHELAHWTGHETRLDRDLTGQFGDAKYAHEEIIAELSKYMTCVEYGLPFHPTDAQSYLKSWAKQSNEDLERVINKAFKEAREASNLICAPLKEQRQDIHQENLKQNPIAQKKPTRIYLNVDKSEKAQVKALGARWHKKEEKWSINTAIHNLKDFEKWLPEEYKNKIQNTTLDDKFNEELQKVIKGELGQDHIFQLGKPSEILLNTGFPDIAIELRASKLWEKSRADWHKFNIDAVQNLPSALQNPIGVFAYGDKNKSQNIITEIEHKGKKFVVGAHFNQEQDSAKFNSIRGLFPKDTPKWLHWIEQGKALYLDKEKVQTLITQQRTNPADVSYLDLNRIENIVQNFENVKEKTEKAPTQNSEPLKQAPPQSLEDRFYQTFYKAHDENQIAQKLLAKKPTYLAIPYEAYQDRQEAKALGASYDGNVKSWYIPVGVDETPLAKFLPQTDYSSHGKSLEDFRIVAERIGLDMRDFRENFNEWHRTRVHNKQGANKDGAYKLFYNHENNSIGGVARNLVTGETVNWINKSQETNKRPKEQQNALELNQNTRINCYNEARLKIAQQRAKDAQALWQILPQATGKEPYIQNKQIADTRNIKALGQNIVLPLQDLKTGEIKSLQLIKADGSKKLMKQGQKTGNGIVLGEHSLVQAETIFIAEGMATADSILQIAKEAGVKNCVAVAGIDANNLFAVAQKIQAINPNAKSYIAADNDLATYNKHLKNPGLDAAKNAQRTLKMGVLVPLSINGQNTDWNDVLLKNGMTQALKEFRENLALKQNDLSKTEPLKTKNPVKQTSQQQTHRQKENEKQPPRPDPQQNKGWER